LGGGQDLTGESALLTTAEVAVAFAGFASVVTVFRRREDGVWAPQDVLRFQLMITASLSVVFFALLPFAISFFDASEPRVWSCGSGALGVYLLLICALFARRTLSLTSGAALVPYISWFFLASGMVVIALLVLNTAGLFLEREIGPYFVGLLYLLLLASVSFARMLPMGRDS
jgi:hypothetical protein